VRVHRFPIRIDELLSASASSRPTMPRPFPATQL
jgi:hypothetical protein